MKFQQVLGYLGIAFAVWLAVVLPNRDLDILACDRLSCDVTRFSWRGEKRVSVHSLSFALLNLKLESVMTGKAISE